jgi:CO dehydrogenase maturation factor
MRVCVVGKGGAGKSMVAGTMARLVAQRGERVLALDADPMPSGMARSLGTKDAPEPLLADAMERKDGGPWRLKSGIGPVTAVRRYAREAPDGVLMLQLGKITLEDHPAFLAATQAFWQLARRLDEVRTFRDWSLIGDTPAGPRQIAADFHPYADTYLVVVEPTWQSVLTARRAAKLARMREARVLPVANKVRGDADRKLIEERLKEPVVAVLPFDEDIKESDRLGIPLVDHAPTSRGVRAIEEIIAIIDARAV